MGVTISADFVQQVADQTHRQLRTSQRPSAAGLYRRDAELLSQATIDLTRQLPPNTAALWWT